MWLATRTILLITVYKIREAGVFASSVGFLCAEPHDRVTSALRCTDRRVCAFRRRIFSNIEWGAGTYKVLYNHWAYRMVIAVRPERLRLKQ